MTEAPGTVRIDKWLWAVRLYKTRTVAAAACTAGKVKVNGLEIKPARSVRPGDTITAQTGEITRTVKVTHILDKRVGAKSVPEFLEDLTPASEYAKPREKSFAPFVFRPKGAGRPTKKERRQLDHLKNSDG